MMRQLNNYEKNLQIDQMPKDHDICKLSVGKNKKYVGNNSIKSITDSIIPTN